MLRWFLHPEELAGPTVVREVDQRHTQSVPSGTSPGAFYVVNVAAAKPATEEPTRSRNGVHAKSGSGRGGGGAARPGNCTSRGSGKHAGNRASRGSGSQ